VRVAYNCRSIHYVSKVAEDSCFCIRARLYRPLKNSKRVPQGRLKIAYGSILGAFQPSPTGLNHVFEFTQDCVLG
jgi:hypothetical protein